MNIISLSPHHYTGLLPKAIEAGRAAIAFLSKTWVTWSLVLLTAGSFGAALVLAVVSMVKQ